ncbi:MAG TPA: ABC transporter substrate-binding protein [Desulfobulbaceae bacterium]|nr:ABC transporter substrate-binding protein [Desulfobulbaceae bacterium]
MTNRRFFSFIVVLVFLFQLFGLAACTRDKEKKEAAGQHKELEKITIAQFGHLFVYLPIYVAKNKGFFKEEGLDVTYVSTGGDEKTWAAVTSGSAQFGVADPTFVAIARERGDNSGRIIASIIDGVPFWGISKKVLSYIKDPQGLNGYKIATYPAPSTNFALMSRLIKQHNLDSRVVQGAFGTLLAMLQNDQADIAMVLEPTVSLSTVKQGYHVVFSYKDIYGDFALTGLSTTTTYINAHPDICQKVVNALQKAYRFVYSNFDGVVEVAQAEFPDFPSEVIRLGVKRMIDDKTIPRSVLVKETSWNEAVALRQYIGDLKGNAPFRDNVDNRFARKGL